AGGQVDPRTSLVGTGPSTGSDTCLARPLLYCSRRPPDRGAHRAGECCIAPPSRAAELPPRGPDARTAVCRWQTARRPALRLAAPGVAAGLAAVPPGGAAEA